MLVFLFGRLPLAAERRQFQLFEKSRQGHFQCRPAGGSTQEFVIALLSIFALVDDLPGGQFKAKSPGQLDAGGVLSMMQRIPMIM